MSSARDLIERDFGALSENNKTLIKKHFGYETYEAMFHSPQSAPPRGESFHAMYDRIAGYYRNILKPLCDAGNTVLVVAHKYPIEMFALVAAGMNPDDYKDFKIPNSRPNSFEELARHARGVVQSVDWLGEMVEIHLPLLLVAALAIGIAAKWLGLALLASLADAGRMEARLFLAALLLFTGVNSFFVFLRTPRETVLGAGGALRRFWLGVTARIVIALVLIFGLRTPLAEAAGLFLLVPPTMAVPTLSLMWGGHYFLSVQLSLALSLVAPLILFAVYVVASATGLPLTMDLTPFFALFAIGVVVPGVLAQIYRGGQAIRAGALSTNWSWIGGGALIPLALAAGFHFTTRDFVRAIGSPSGLGRVGANAAVAVGLLIAVRLIGVFSARVVTRSAKQAIDGYLSTIAPNIFFWCSLIATGNTLLTLPMLVLYFGSLWIEDRRFVRRYAHALEARI